MAKKKAAKKATKKATKKTTSSIGRKKGAKKSAAKKTTAKKAAKKKPAAKKSAKKLARAKGASKSAVSVGRSGKKAPTKRPAAKKSASRKRPPRLKANEHLEKMSVEIEKEKSGDLVVTESAGGTIKVHHTIHPEAEQTPFPGNTYDDLKDLGAGTHEIEVKRTIELPPAPTGGM
jgi:hypothetical protein